LNFVVVHKGSLSKFIGLLRMQVDCTMTLLHGSGEKRVPKRTKWTIKPLQTALQDIFTYFSPRVPAARARATPGTRHVALGHALASCGSSSNVLASFQKSSLLGRKITTSPAPENRAHRW
jgi:hypothetical protein